MSSETDSSLDPEKRVRELERSLQLYVEYRTDPNAPSPDEFLERHAELRELLEPMLQGDLDATIASEIGRARTEILDRIASSTESGDFEEQEAIGPYQIIELIAEGGMGRVYRARQTEPVKREVALKLIKLGMDTREVIARFEVERQALALMSHPNIATVFDAGATPAGQPYFVMEYVPGLPLVDYCDSERLSNRARIELFLDVCRGVQHAHQKGVIHRDLTPSNILVTVEGDRLTPKVIDFGIAKAADDRLEVGAYLTEWGRFIGTPEYMSPEQVQDGFRDIDTRSDIYSLGVVLYELIVGRVPFDVHSLGGNRDELRRLIREEEVPRASSRVLTLEESGLEPARQRRTSTSTLARSLKGELDWILFKALAKDRARRYPTAAALAADLQRYLAGEPVEARPPSGVYRLRKFANRHRRFVSGLALTLLILAAALVVTLTQKGVVEDALDKAESQRKRAAENLDLAEQRLEEVVRLSDARLLEQLRKESRALQPVVPSRLAEAEDWLRRAQELSDRLPRHVATLELVRKQATPYSEQDRENDRKSHPLQPDYKGQRKDLETLREEWGKLEGAAEDARDEAQREALQQALARKQASCDWFEKRIDERTTWKFERMDLQWQHDLLADLVAELEHFRDPLGVLGSRAPGELVTMKAELDRALEIQSSMQPGAPGALSWSNAIESIAVDPQYGGLRLRPQEGLLPLGQNPESGLWEFWHVLSGERPEPAPEGSPSPWIMRPETGMVLILVPAGSFRMGAQSQDADANNFDSMAEKEEAPPHEVTLEPYFLSRYELTQGQWERLEGYNQANYRPGWKFEAGGWISLVHPVESITWPQSESALKRWGMCFPTESQWEYAARAGTTTPWWCGATVESLQDHANLRDAACKRSGAPEAWIIDPLEDGYGCHSPVGTYTPNPWGFHDVHGNVMEWCLDAYGEYDVPARPGDGARTLLEKDGYISRGGSWYDRALLARSAYRGNYYSPETAQAILGVRPARGIED